MKQLLIGICVLVILYVCIKLNKKIDEWLTDRVMKPYIEEENKKKKEETE